MDYSFLMQSGNDSCPVIMIAKNVKPLSVLRQVVKASGIEDWKTVDSLRYWKLITPVASADISSLQFRSPATDPRLEEIPGGITVLETLDPEAETKSKLDPKSVHFNLLMTTFSYPSNLHFVLNTAPQEILKLETLVIHSDTMMMEIQTAIQKKLGCEMRSIRLYALQPTLPCDDIIKAPMRAGSTGTCIAWEDDTIKKYFPNGIESGHVHFIVTIGHDFLTPGSTLSPFEKSRNAYLQHCKDKLTRPASSSAAPDGSVDLRDFNGSDTLRSNSILCHRPSRVNSIFPIHVFEKAFADFIDNTSSKSTLQLTQKDYEMAQTWRDVVNNPCPGERWMTDVLQMRLAEYGIDFVMVKSQKEEQDSADEGEKIDGRGIVILDYRSELGEGDPASMLEGVRWQLSNLIQLQKDRKIRPDYLEPCMIILAVGPYLGVYGSLFIKNVMVDNLHPLESFLFHPSSLNRWKQAARLFAAIKIAHDDLKTKLLALPQLVPFHEASVTDLPYQREYIDSHGATQRVEDMVQIQPHQRIFHGKLVNGTPVAVKYVQEYSAEAHRHCAQIGFAPELLGFTEMAGGWNMVVMPFLDSTWSPLCDEDITYDIKDEQAMFARRKIEEFVAAGWVHGDIRDVNVMISHEVGDEGVYLIDFDWAGKEGEVFYPFDMKMEPETIRRPYGADPLKPISRIHDLEMIKKIFG